MRPNPLRELYDVGLPTLGTRIQSSWPTIVELIGDTGKLDYVEFLAPYAPYDLYALDNLGRAVELFDHLAGMMKIEAEPRTYLATRAIGAGLQNLLFADVRSADDVRACLAAARSDTPDGGGLHGVAMRRDVGTVLEVGTAPFVEAVDRAVVGFMIEKQSAFDDLDEILGLNGLDFVVFGPGDYAMSVGLPGQFGHPRIKEAEEHLISSAHRAGVAFRAELGSPADADRYLELGVRHFMIGVDTVVLYEWLTANGQAMLDVLGREAPAPGARFGRGRSGYGSEQ